MGRATVLGVTRMTPTVSRFALALLALVAISPCRRRTTPDLQEFLVRRLTRLQAAAGIGAPEWAPGEESWELTVSDRARADLGALPAD